MKKWLSVILCAVFLLGLGAAGAYAQEGAYLDLLYTVPEGWTHMAMGEGTMLVYAGNDDGNCMIAIFAEDAGLSGDVELETPQAVQEYLEAYLQRQFGELGLALPDFASTQLVDGQTAVRYALQEQGAFIDALGVLYDQRAYGVVAMGNGENAYRGYEALLASLRFGGESVAAPGQDDPLAELSDEDVKSLRDRAAEALGAKAIELKDGEFVVGEDIPAGQYMLCSADANIPAVVKIESRDEMLGCAGEEQKLCRLSDGDVLQVTCAMRFTPRLNVPVTTNAQNVRDIQFLLPPGWTGSTNESGFSGYTEADTQARTCGYFCVLPIPLSDSAERTTEETFQQALSAMLALGYDLNTSEIMEIEGRPAMRFSLVSNQNLLYNPCMEGLFVLEKDMVYSFLVEGQDLYQDNFAYGLDILADFVTFEGVEPLPELSAQTDLEKLRPDTLRRIYTLCEFSLVRRGASAEVKLPGGIVLVGVDFPAGSYEISTTGMCQYGVGRIISSSDAPLTVAFEDGQTIETIFGDTTLIRQ